MSIAPGTRIGHYVITGSLGAGGMGEVYRARDTRLDRDIAIKVLPEALAGDPDRLARFRREAQVLASLNHPNIAHIHGIEDDAGTHALVMELVEGEDLAQRLARGPLPLAGALPIARQIAEALEAAHEQGIVHRDLKPANVKVRPDGTVKVLDFGLAKAVEPPGAPTVDPTASPTLTERATRVGVILGTAAYMAPEQARGRAVDRRADIWAFGALLYEALSGKRAFAGEDATDVLAAVLRQDIDWSALPAGTPPALRRLLERCLERDPKQRLRDIGEARFAIDELIRQPVATTTTVSPPRAGRGRPRVGWGLGLVGAAACGAVAPWLLLPPRGDAGVRAPAARGGPVRATIELPETAPLALGARVPVVGFDSTALALSPDGRYLAYVGQAASGTMLYLRELAAPTVTPLEGTEGTSYAFFSPDSRWVGFLTTDKVKKVALNGGAPVTVCEARTPVRAQWTRDDTISFSEDYGQSLSRVAAAGGRPERVGQPGESAWRFSDVSPDGRWALRTDHLRSISGDYADVVIVPLAGGPAKVLVRSGYDARFVPPATLLFGRAGTLHAVAFDPETGETRGDPQPVAGGVGMDSLFQQVHAAVAPGVIAYVPGGQRALGRLASVDEQGRVEFLDAPVATYGVVDLSDDGRRLAVHVGDVTDYVLLYDIARHEGRRLGIGDSAGWPIWSHDGTSLALGTWKDWTSGRRIVSARADGGGPAREIVPAAAAAARPYSWSPDGRVLAISTLARDPTVSFVRADGDAARPEQGAFPGHMPSFSPDGRFVAYVSAETGQIEIFVRPYPDGGGARQVSAGGGGEPVWCPCGELFWRNANRWMSVRIRTQPDLQWDAPRLRFETDFIDTPGRSYDVSPDGKRLFVVKRVAPDVRNRIDVVVNWTDLLRSSAPAQ